MIKGQTKSIFYREIANKFHIGMAGLFTAFALFLLGWIILTIVQKGIHGIDLNFFTQPTVPDESGGVGNAILGTVMMIGFASFFAIPIGVFGGVFLAEYARQSKLGHYIRFSANVMMGVPSIIVGLFVYAMVVITMGTASGFAGSIAIGMMMLPITMRITEDVLCMVPNALRESALALGMPRWKAILVIIFKYARNGLVTGLLLSIARVSGETAPLLFTAQWSMHWPSVRSFFTSPTANLTVSINEYFGNDFRIFMQERAWAAALIILIFILGLNISIRLFFSNKNR